MATTEDLALPGLVSKYLSRRVVSPRTGKGTDTSEEILAVLESVTITFLLYPQAALEFLLQAKNVLQQVVSADLDLLDFIADACEDLDNPDDVPVDTSSLVSAQTALVELDRLQRLGSNLAPYTRYNAAIRTFLTDELAKTVKRKGRQKNGQPVFERTALEAKSDLLSAINLFALTHAEMIERISTLASGLSGFLGADLSRIVSQKTITKVRSSLKQILSGAEDGSLSKTVMAIELLSGASALESISGQRSPLDPSVRTGSLPRRRTIYFRSEAVAAVAESAAGPWSLGAGPWTFTCAVDRGVPLSRELPATGASGRVWLLGKGVSWPLTNSAGALYLRVNGLDVSVALGANLSLAGTIATINAANLGVTAQELAAGTGRLLLVGGVGISSLAIVSAPLGSFPGGIYTLAQPLHRSLGFSDNQESAPLGMLSAEEAAELLSSFPGVLFSAADGKLRVTSSSSGSTSALGFGDKATAVLGLSAFVSSEPAYAELVEGGTALVPASVNVFVGSRISTTGTDPDNRTLTGYVTRIEDTKLFFAEPLPRGSSSLEAIDPLVDLFTRFLSEFSRFTTVFKNDVTRLQLSLAPLLSAPTRSQIADAQRELATIRSKLDNGSSALKQLLEAFVVADAQRAYVETARNIIKALDERGLDRAMDLLVRGNFSEFFTLTQEVASRSTRLLKAVEEVGRKDLPSSTAEEDQRDGNRLLGTGPNTLQDRNTSL